MDCLYQLAVVLQGLAPRHTQASKIFLAAVQQDAPLLMGETAALVIQLGELSRKTGHTCTNDLNHSANTSNAV